MCKKTIWCNSKIDRCMKSLIKLLQKDHYNTVASCCGHGKYQMTIVIKNKKNRKVVYKELLSNTIIPRTTRFYKRDEEGYYYIPEVQKETKWRIIK